MRLKKINLEPYLEKTAHTLVWERIGPQLRAIPLLGSFVNDGILAKFEVIACAEIKNEAGPLIEKVATQFEASVDLKQMIEDNIAAFDLERLEGIVNAVAKREFRTIERFRRSAGLRDWLPAARIILGNRSDCSVIDRPPTHQR